MFIVETGVLCGNWGGGPLLEGTVLTGMASQRRRRRSAGPRSHVPYPALPPPGEFCGTVMWDNVPGIHAEPDQGWGTEQSGVYAVLADVGCFGE